MVKNQKTGYHKMRERTYGAEVGRFCGMERRHCSKSTKIRQRLLVQKTREIEYRFGRL